MTNVGEPAPDFEAKTNRGATFRLSAQDQLIVLFFFPKAFTAG